jgi:hypothetical protein
MRIALAVLVIVVAPSLALSQSGTATTGTTKPMTTAPASNAPSSNTRGISEPKSKIPPAARSGQKGLRYGEGAADGGPIEVKRNK